MNSRKDTTVFALLIFAEIACAHPLDMWTWRNPIPPPITLQGITYGKGQFVAVGENGIIVTSADAANWVLRQSGTRAYLAAAAYGNGQFVAVGRATDPDPLVASIVTSADGVKWLPQQPTTQLSAIAYGNGKFVAVGGSILTSINAVNWIQSNTSLTADTIAYGNGQFVAVGGRTILTSADGINWSQAERANWPGYPTSVAYGNGHFVIGAWDSDEILISSNGVDWSSLPAGTRGVHGLAYGGGQFVALARRGAPVTSTDGMRWVQRQWLTGRAIAYGNGHFVLVGRGGTILESASILSLSIAPAVGTGLLSLSLEGPSGLNYTIQTSTDLISWRNLTNITSAQPTNVIFDALPAASDHVFYRAYSQ